MVVLSKPLIDDDLCLLYCCEPFGVEHFVARGSVEAFVISILPGCPRIDPYGFDADPNQPVLHYFGDELWAVVQ